MFKCSTLTVIKEMQIKMMRWHFLSIQLVRIYKIYSVKVGMRLSDSLMHSERTHFSQEDLSDVYQSLKNSHSF